MNQITIDKNYRSVLQQYNALLENAEKIKQVRSEELQAFLSGVSNNWKDSQGDEYVRKLKVLLAQIETSQNVIVEAASSLKQLADTKKTAEESALRIASQRSGGKK